MTLHRIDIPFFHIVSLCIQFWIANLIAAVVVACLAGTVGLVLMSVLMVAALVVG